MSCPIKSFSFSLERESGFNLFWVGKNQPPSTISCHSSDERTIIPTAASTFTLNHPWIGEDHDTVPLGWLYQPDHWITCHANAQDIFSSNLYKGYSNLRLSSRRDLFLHLHTKSTTKAPYNKNLTLSWSSETHSSGGSRKISTNCIVEFT